VLAGQPDRIERGWTGQGRTGRGKGQGLPQVPLAGAEDMFSKTEIR